VGESATGEPEELTPHGADGDPAWQAWKPAAHAPVDTTRRVRRTAARGRQGARLIGIDREHVSAATRLISDGLATAPLERVHEHTLSTAPSNG
jgi:hypothetical protein